MIQIGFDDCFPRAKIRRLMPLLPKTYAALDELAPWREGKWPTRVHCMSAEQILEARPHGAGHGSTYVCETGECNEVWINPFMSWEGLWLVLVHENLHHAYPDATEDEINCLHVPAVYERVFGRKRTHDWFRRHGLGAPVAGVGDRSYCR